MAATAKSISSASSPDSNNTGPEFQIECFRCGECCTGYHVRLSLVEAQRIADELGLAFDDYLDRYIDKDWRRDESFILRWRNDECIFLERVQGSHQTGCLIHQVKPAVCREWLPSPRLRECQQGLARYWRLTVSASEQLEGREADLRDFHSFLKSVD